MLPMPESVDYFLKNNVASELDYYVWLFPNEDSFPVIKELSLKLNKPFILFDRLLPDSGETVSSALLNEGFAVRQAVNLLANYGRKNILFLYRMERQYNARRIDFFKKALVDKGIEFNSDNIVNVGSGAGYARKVAEMIVDRMPDAVFFAQGAISQDILPHLYSRGIAVPDDLSVITFDRINAPYDIAITCIYSDYEKLAVLSAEYVIAKLREPEADVALPVVRSDLIMGESCAPL
jgi:DNA-binding LacI/PurR family transcriptional regulator